MSASIRCDPLTGLRKPFELEEAEEACVAELIGLPSPATWLGSVRENSFIRANPSLAPPCILRGATMGLTLSRDSTPAAPGAISIATALLLPCVLNPIIGLLAVSLACATLPDLALLIKLCPLLTPPAPAAAKLPNLRAPLRAALIMSGRSLTTSFFASFSARCWSYLSLILLAASTFACSISPLVRK